MRKRGSCSDRNDLGPKAPVRLTLQMAARMSQKLCHEETCFFLHDVKEF